MGMTQIARAPALHVPRSSVPDELAWVGEPVNQLSREWERKEKTVSICNGFIVYIENLSELTRKKLQL
jgi:hypothetical protein